MAKLSSFLTDTKAINDGAWVVVNEALYDDFAIKTKGFTDEFVDAQAARVKRVRADAGISDDVVLPNALQREINASLLRDHLVLDVRNLEGDDGAPITVEAFHDLLDKPNAARLVRACWEAASKVSARTAKANEEALGN